jgi:hypothetical protein
VVNTVNFSNHAGYGRSGGTKTTAEELNAMFESMEYNELLMPTRLLTGIDDFSFLPNYFTIFIGYIPGAESLSAIHKIAEKLKHSKPNLIYLLDRTRFFPCQFLFLFANFRFFLVIFSCDGRCRSSICRSGCDTCL